MPEESVDVITLIFVLSAVHPDKMKLVLQNISRVGLLRYVIFFSFLCKAQIFLDMPDRLQVSPGVCVNVTTNQTCVCEGRRANTFGSLVSMISS